MAPPPAGRAPARAAGDHQRPGQDPDVRRATSRCTVFTGAGRDLGRGAGRRRSRRCIPTPCRSTEQDGDRRAGTGAGAVRGHRVTTRRARRGRARARRHEPATSSSRCRRASTTPRRSFEATADAAGRPRPLPAAPGGRRVLERATSPPAPRPTLTGETMTTARLDARHLPDRGPQLGRPGRQPGAGRGHVLQHRQPARHVGARHGRGAPAAPVRHHRRR